MREGQDGLSGNGGRSIGRCGPRAKGNWEERRGGWEGEKSRGQQRTTERRVHRTRTKEIKHRPVCA